MKIDAKGAALATVVAMIVVIMILAIAGLSASLSSSQMGFGVIDKIKAGYFAEAGIQRAMYKIKTETDPTQNSISPWLFEGQNVSVNISVNAAGYQVTSTCAYQPSGETKTLTATVYKQDANATLITWG